mmetsp:Transcript_19604/g.49067  ORF Transcript_19604/g.49067 Transcript_19604/m.49067 type:complete len:562 (-) Transcript_19604:917-2602(-)
MIDAYDGMGWDGTSASALLLADGLLLLALLQAEQTRVRAALQRHQLLVRAALAHHPAGDDVDAVGVAHGAEAVRHHHGGVAAHGDQAVQRLLHRRLALQVQRARGLVQQQQLRVAQKNARDGQALALPAAEPHAALAQPRVVPVREGLDEVVRVGRPRRRLDQLRGRLGGVVLVPVPDVAADGVVEDLHVLHHQPYVLVHGAQVQLPQVRPVERDGARLDVVVPQQQRDDRGLAAPALAHQRRRGPAGDGHVHLVDHHGVGPHLVPKLDLLEGDVRAPVARPVRPVHRPRARLDVRQVVLQREHARGGAGGAHQASQAAAERGVAGRDAVEVQLEGDEAADGEARVGALHGHAAAQPQDQHRGAQLQQIGQRHRQRPSERVLHPRAQGGLGVLVVAPELHVLRGHGAHGADVAQRLVGHVGGQPQHGGDLAVQRLAPARVPLDEERDGHHHGERHHGEAPAHPEAHGQAAQDDHEVLRRQAHHGVARAGEVGAVVAEAAEQVAGVDAVEVRDVLRQHVLEQPRAHLVVEALPHQGEARALEGGEERHAHGGHQQHERRAVE